MSQRIQSQSLASSIDSFDKIPDRIRELSKSLIKAANGKMFPVDFMTIAALKRTYGNHTGFKSLIKNSNMSAARSLLRIQVDTLIRYHAIWLVDQPHDFAADIMDGARIDKITDRDGNKMRDFYLINKLKNEYDWLPEVYSRLSGYVHFSGSHISSAVDQLNEKEIIFNISDTEKFPEISWIEAVDCFTECTLILFRYIYGWIKTKDMAG